MERRPPLPERVGDYRHTLSGYLGVPSFPLSIAMGLGFDFVLGDAPALHGLHEHGGTDWIAVTGALVVIGLMLFLSALRGADRKDLVLKVEGMTCQHCVARTKQTLEGFDTVEEATPSLSSGQVQAVEKAGYKVVD